MPRIHIIGRKNSGKTTLIEDLISELTARGLRVGTVKHTHHHHELDTPGKDSFRHRAAGASAVGILSPQMNAIFWPSETNGQKDARYEQFEALMADCDVVLVEGHSQTEGCKLEVWRKAIADQPYAAEDSTIRAVISDDEFDTDVPCWPRNDVANLADQIQKLATYST